MHKVAFLVVCSGFFCLTEERKYSAYKRNPGYRVENYQSVADTFLSKQGLHFVFSRFLPKPSGVPASHQLWLCQASRQPAPPGRLLSRCRSPSLWHGVRYFQNHKADKLFMRCFCAVCSERISPQNRASSLMEEVRSVLLTVLTRWQNLWRAGVERWNYLQSIHIIRPLGAHRYSPWICFPFFIPFCWLALLGLAFWSTWNYDYSGCHRSWGKWHTSSEGSVGLLSGLCVSCGDRIVVWAKSSGQVLCKI